MSVLYCKTRGRKCSTNLHELGLGTGFLDTTPKAQVEKEKVGKLDFIKT